MQDYIAEEWRQTLQENNLQSFDDWWDKKAEWFEPPNQRRGGWSGVSRVELGNRVVFLKRQENHLIRTLTHPFRGMPTFTREMENILALKKAQVPALTPVYFAQRNVNGSLRAILVTESLEGYQPLENIQPAALSISQRVALIQQIATVIKQLHQHKLVHNCLYPKHLFVRGSEAGFDVRLIDLEKARKRLRRKSAVFRDLDTLNRHSNAWSLSDRCHFMKVYFGEQTNKQRNTQDWRQCWRRLARRNFQRVKRHQER